MKDSYPKYAEGLFNKIEESLSKENKTKLDQFLKKCAETVQEKKISEIKREMLRFIDITERDLSKDSKKRQNAESINCWLVIINHSELAGWTKCKHRTYVKKFLEWEYANEPELWKHISNPKRDKKGASDHLTESDLISQEETALLIENARSLRDKCLISVADEGGLRPEELLNLKFQNLDFQDKCVVIKIHSSKTGNTRSVPLVRSKDFLWLYKQTYPYPHVKGLDFIFPSPMDRNKPLNTATLNQVLRVTAKRAGINKKIWAYLFRHSRATKLYEELPQPLCEKILGHKNMAGVYAHISDKKAQNEMLSKIYKIEELPKEKREELEKRVTELIEINQLMTLKILNKISNKEFKERLSKIASISTGEKIKIIDKEELKKSGFDK